MVAVNDGPDLDVAEHEQHEDGADEDDGEQVQRKLGPHEAPADQAVAVFGVVFGWFFLLINKILLI